MFVSSPNPAYHGRQAMIGGYVYRGKKYPALYGYYLCSDYISSDMWKIKSNASGLTVSMQSNIPPGIASYGEGEDGKIYAASRKNGMIYRIEAAQESPLTSAGSEKFFAAFNGGIKIYPTIINNNIICIESVQLIRYARITDMAGNVLMNQKISGAAGKTIITLPSSLNAGTYLLHLEGAKKVTQKIYVSR